LWKLPIQLSQVSWQDRHQTKFTPGKESTQPVTKLHCRQVLCVNSSQV
jgi:hypothetical protein